MEALFALLLLAVVPFVILAVAFKVLLALVLLPFKILGGLVKGLLGLIGGLFGLVAGGVGLVVRPARPPRRLRPPAARAPAPAGGDRVAGPQGLQPGGPTGLSTGYRAGHRPLATRRAVGFDGSLTIRAHPSASLTSTRCARPARRWW